LQYHFPLDETGVSFNTSKQQLAGLISLSKNGSTVKGLFLIDPLLARASLPKGCDISRILLLEADLFFVQENGDIVVLLGGANGAYELTLDGLTNLFVSASKRSR